MQVLVIIKLVWFVFFDLKIMEKSPGYVKNIADKFFCK